MKNFKVYLAGPISGQTYAGANDWREYAKKELAKGKMKSSFGYFNTYVPITSSITIEPEYEHTGIYGYSPMRAKGYLEDMARMPEHHKGEVKTPLPQILNRDHWDCKTSDAILCNLLDVERVSIGSVMEIAWAYAYRIPLVLVTNEGNVHLHGLIQQSVGWETDNLATGIQMIKDILLP